MDEPPEDQGQSSDESRFGKFPFFEVFVPGLLYHLNRRQCVRPSVSWRVILYLFQTRSECLYHIHTMTMPLIKVY